MPVLLPPVEGGVLHERSPVVGSPADAAQAAQVLRGVVRRLEEMIGHTVQASGSLNAMRAVSIRNLQARLDSRVVSGARAFTRSVTAGAQAFGRYASEIEEIHTAAHAVVTRVESELAVIVAASRRLDAACEGLGVGSRCVPERWNAPPSVFPPADPGESVFAGAETVDPAVAARGTAKRAARAQAEAEWASAVRIWLGAVERVCAEQRLWRALVEDRRNAEHALVNALDRTDIGELIRFSGGPVPASMFQTDISGTSRPRSLADDPNMRRILSGGLSETEVAAAWKAIRESARYGKSEVQNLPLDVLAVLARTNGIPAWVQDIAGRAVLDHALADPASAYELMYGSPPGDPLALTEFMRHVEGLNEALVDADRRIGKDLPAGTRIQLVNLGTHDGALTAGISLGNLDRASHVGVNYAGMNSSVAGIGNGVDGAAEIFKEARDVRPGSSYAVVMMIGYRPPSFAGVASMARATGAAESIASFLDGIQASRGTRRRPVEQFAVFAHSYGSTAVAEALQHVSLEFKIDSFVTYGSAGFAADTTLDGLRHGITDTGHLYATHAAGDGLAQLPIKAQAGTDVYLSDRVDPRQLGAAEFSAEGGRGEKRTNAHDMFVADVDEKGSPSEKVGYLSPGTSSVREIASILATGKLRSDT
jgi:hypothetical protein